MSTDHMLIDEPFVAYLPSLCRHLGGNPVRAIIMQVLWFARDRSTNECVMSYTEMSRRTGIADRTLRDHTKWLRDEGHLSSHRRSTMDATQVWSVHLQVEAADPAVSTPGPETADPATSTHPPANPAISETADLATSTYIEEEEVVGGAVTEVSTEQQHLETVVTTTALDGAVTHRVTTKPFPWWASQHHLMQDVDIAGQTAWLKAWTTVCALENMSHTPEEHLTRYLARMSEMKKRPHPDEWVRWFIDDDQKLKRELAIAKQKARVEDQPKNPDWQ